MNRKLYTLFTTLLAIAVVVSSCIKDDFTKNSQYEEITIRLAAGTHAAETDGLIYGDDGKFGSLALFVFDEKRNFVLLHKEEFNASNTRQVSFNCLSNAKTLLGVANYHLYPDLAAQLKEGLTLNGLKALVANATGTVELNDKNILMVGEKEIPAFTQEKENIDVSLSLKRLAARIDVHTFKEAGWTANVQLISVEFSNGVSNTVLNNADGMLPEELTYAPSRDTEVNKNLDEINVTDWKNTANRNGCFYSYRTNLVRNNATAPRLKFKVLINGNIRKEYETVIANEQDLNAILDAGNVYQVKAVLSKTGMTMNTIPVQWDDENSELNFTDNLLYTSHGWMPGTFVERDGNTVQLSVGVNGIISFSLLSPNTVTWRAVLTNTEYFRLKQSEGKYEVSETGEVIRQQLEIELLHPEYTGFVQTELAVYAVVGGLSYELDLTHDGTEHKPSESINRFTITRGEQ